MFGLRDSNRRRRTSSVRNLFHGVSIELAEGCTCRAARAVSGKRFLADEAPMLPLESCDSPSQCACIYRHYDDRRSAARRESDLGLPHRAHARDVRTGAGRRITDG